MQLRTYPGIAAVAILSMALTAPIVTVAGSQPQNQADAASHRVTKRAVKKPNGSGIDITYSVDESVKVGEPATVVIQFDGITDPAGGSARFTSDAGLKISAPESVRLPPGESTTVTIQAIPGSEGVAYLNVFTTQNGATAATSIAVQGGKGGPKLRSGGGELKKTPSGESVISMPAR